MTDTGRLHQNVLSKQRSGVQTTHSGMKRTTHQMREAISIEVSRARTTPKAPKQKDPQRVETTRVALVETTKAAEAVAMME